MDIIEMQKEVENLEAAAKAAKAAFEAAWAALPEAQASKKEVSEKFDHPDYWLEIPEASSRAPAWKKAEIAKAAKAAEARKARAKAAYEAARERQTKLCREHPGCSRQFAAYMAAVEAAEAAKARLKEAKRREAEEFYSRILPPPTWGGKDNDGDWAE